MVGSVFLVVDGVGLCDKMSSPRKGVLFLASRQQ